MWYYNSILDGVSAFNAFFLNISGELCAADIEAISNWKLELTVDDGDLLVESGKDELRQLGQRFKVRLPDLFDEYSEEDVIFRTTNR